MRTLNRLNCWACAFLASLMALITLSNIGCTRQAKKQGSTTLTFSAPGSLVSGKATDNSGMSIPGVHKLTFAQSANPDDGGDWAPGMPLVKNDVTCFAIVVAPPRFTGGVCEVIDSSNEIVGYINFGLIVGFASAGETLSLNVPSGPAQSIQLWGSKSISGTCPRMINPWIPGGGPDGDGDVDTSVITRPLLLAAQTVDLRPGNQAITLVGNFNANADRLASCDDLSNPRNHRNYPDPTNEYNFLSGVMPSGPTYTRSGPATYFDALGFLTTENTSHTPRFEYDPNSGEPLGLLIESAATNYLLYSADFTQPAWVGSYIASLTCVEGDITGGSNGCSIDDDNVSNLGFVKQMITSGSPQDITFSVFMKAGTSDVAGIKVNNGTNYGFVVDLITGATSALDVWTLPARGFGVQPVGGGWFRVWMSIVDTGTPMPAEIYSAVAAYGAFNPGGTTTSDVSVTGDISTYGAQFELGLFPTSYIATGASSANRNSDALTFPSLPSFDHLQGTFDIGFSYTYVENGNQAGNPRYLFNMTDGTNSWMSKVLFNIGPPMSYDLISTFYDPSPNTVSTPSSFSLAPGALHRVVVSYYDSDQTVGGNDMSYNLALDTNAVTQTNSLNGLTTTFTTFNIGSDAGMQNQLNGHIKWIQHWDFELGSEQLEDIASEPNQ